MLAKFWYWWTINFSDKSIHFLFDVRNNSLSIRAVDVASSGDETSVIQLLSLAVMFSKCNKSFILLFSLFPITNTSESQEVYMLVYNATNYLGGRSPDIYWYR